ncbi:MULTISPECIES: NfeD family protein [Thiomicrorhabdus]|uniref:NfeD family protein n=1 Tax=Thiomicrorhabdus heinhorstiae TaxID=2748010 RepID=A0ABS0BUR8_9GAMM|nr:MULTISPECIES: NfeD family protein [Thiomicrorhabdus]MBF6057520.1 NfeD family protein [Thiomicrorhabdus heinhorstiae]
MFELMTDSSINPSILIIVGILLMLGEVLIIGTFVLFWVALAFILIGLFGFYQPVDWRFQLLAITVLGGLFTWLLNPYLKKAKHTHEADSFAPTNPQEFGRLHQDKNGNYSVFYRGTYWLIDPLSPPDNAQPEEEVLIVAVKGNFVTIKPVESVKETA